MAAAHWIKPSAMFEPVPGGFIFRAPTPWIFGSTRRYFVEEDQYAEQHKSSANKDQKLLQKIHATRSLKNGISKIAI